LSKRRKRRGRSSRNNHKTDLKTSFAVSVKNTGVSKDVNDLTAQEQLVTMQMHVTDPNALRPKA
jgi:hypothetical protein